MIKRILISAAVGGAVLLTGVVMYEMTAMHSLGDTVAGIGFAYMTLSLCALVIPLYHRAIGPRIRAAYAKRSQTRAYDDLLRYKTLLDQQIISKEEFESKSRELKAKLLEGG